MGMIEMVECPYGEDDDGVEESCCEFWVLLDHIGTGNKSIIHVEKSDGEWYEDNVLGNKGGDKRYMSYLTSDDVFGWFMRDFGDRYYVEMIEDEGEVRLIMEQESNKSGDD